jgi:hypothetical protein
MRVSSNAWLKTKVYQGYCNQVSTESNQQTMPQSPNYPQRFLHWWFSASQNVSSGSGPHRTFPVFSKKKNLSNVWTIYYIPKHGVFVGECMVTTIPSGFCKETKWACNWDGGWQGDPLVYITFELWMGVRCLKWQFQFGTSHSLVFIQISMDKVRLFLIHSAMNFHSFCNEFPFILQWISIHLRSQGRIH